MSSVIEAIVRRSFERIPSNMENKIRRSLHTSDVSKYKTSIDPFQTFWISPESITDYTRRPYPPVKKRYEQLGNVLEGIWDTRDEIPFKNESYRARYELYLGETFSDSPFYQSLEDHFGKGVDWKNTELVERSLDLINNGEKGWRGAQSNDRINDLCKSTDMLYESISKNGYLSQKELGRKSITRVIDEVCVDLDRNGSPLFVDGKHRLAIAKILDVDEIPVTVLVRHKKWMQKIEKGKVNTNKLH